MHCGVYLNGRERCVLQEGHVTAGITKHQFASTRPKRELRDQQEFAISQVLTGTFEAVCTRCERTDEMLAEDTAQASLGFYESGWRIIGDKLICKKVQACMKAKLTGSRMPLANELSVEDWKDFYESLTSFVDRVRRRHKSRIKQEATCESNGLEVSVSRTTGN